MQGAKNEMKEERKERKKVSGSYYMLLIKRERWREKCVKHKHK
jgi:hypothetical protein